MYNDIYIHVDTYVFIIFVAYFPAASGKIRNGRPTRAGAAAAMSWDHSLIYYRQHILMYSSKFIYIHIYIFLYT